MCSTKLYLAMISNEIKCHVNTFLGLVGGCIPCIPPCVRPWSSSSFNDAFIHTPRYFTWSKNCTRTPFRKTFDGAGCLQLFGQKTPIVLLQLKVISCSAA